MAGGARGYQPPRGELREGEAGAGQGAPAAGQRATAGSGRPVPGEQAERRMRVRCKQGPWVSAGFLASHLSYPGHPLVIMPFAKRSTEMQWNLREGSPVLSLLPNLRSTITSDSDGVDATLVALLVCFILVLSLGQPLWIIIFPLYR